MSVLLKRIDSEGLAADIDKLAGPEFLQHVRNVHPRYEGMVQASLQREQAGKQRRGGAARRPSDRARVASPA